MPLKGYGLVVDITVIMEEIINKFKEHRQREKEKEEEEERQRQQQRLRFKIPTQTETEEEEKKKKEYPVVVVGCGASGIACLSKLADADVKAIGLEASDRMGGRIKTVDFGQNVVDLGAAWCHGEVNNLVYREANPYGLLGRPERPEDGDENEDWFVLSDGTVIPHGNANDVLETIQKAVDKSDKFNSRTISEFVRTGVKNNQIMTSPAVLPITEPFLEWYERENHLGGAINPRTGKSLQGLVRHEKCLGEFWLNWKGKGYKTILNLLMGNHPAQGSINSKEIHIEYNKEVKHILWMVPDPDPEDPVPVLVVCNDGTIVKASKVVVTVSLGVLKERYMSMFLPSLPADKILAIENLQFCILDKIYIEFDQPWWPRGLTNLKILWRLEDKTKFTGTDIGWVTGIYGLRTVEHQPNVMLAWLYDRHAAEMEAVGLDTVKKGIEKLLDILKINFDVTPVKRITRSTWASDPLIRGSYSYRAASTEEAGVGAETFLRPLANQHGPAVFFAGEAASKRWHNAVHGAIDAGYRAASNVCGDYDY